MRACDHIDIGTHKWKFELLDTMLHPENAALVQAIPLSDSVRLLSHSNGEGRNQEGEVVDRARGRLTKKCRTRYGLSLLRIKLNISSRSVLMVFFQLERIYLEGE